jgi:hypothetical protein
MRFLSALVLTVAAVLAVSVTSCETGNGDPVPVPELDAGPGQTSPHHDAFQPPGDVFEPVDSTFFPDAQLDGGSIGNPDAF